MSNITGLLVYNQSMWSANYQKMLDLYHQASQQLFLQLCQKSNLSLCPAVVNGVFSLEIEPNSFDFCLFLDKDVLLAEQIQAMGIPVFNSPQSIALCDNKIAMTQRLCQQNIPLCDTFFSTTQFFPQNEADFMENVTKTLGFPLIIKEAYGSFGEQVYLAQNQNEMITIRNKIGKNPYLYQRFLPSTQGRDLRIYVCDGEVVGAMKRENFTDFRANLSIGGHISPHTPTESEKNLAISANSAMGTLFSGVDIIWDSHENPILCEVNASAHIKHYQEFSGENLALPILSAICSRL